MFRKVQNIFSYKLGYTNTSDVLMHREEHLFSDNGAEVFKLLKFVKRTIISTV